MKKVMNKKLTKALLLTACALVLVCATVMGTVAYLTSQTETVTNTFTYGNVKITMNDIKTDVYGKALTGESADRTISNDYKLVPGNTYEKDTTIYVEQGSEECYLFVKVATTVVGNENVLTYNFESGWTSLGNGVYYYTNKVNASNAEADVSVPVIDTLTVADTVTDLSAFNSKTVTVIGYAVQAAGFTSAEAAWNATFGKPADPQA